MKVYTFSQARQNLSEVLNRSKKEAVLIRRRSGEAFVIKPTTQDGSPFDVPGVKTKARMADVLAAIRDSRQRG